MWNSIVSVPDHCLFIYFPSNSPSNSLDKLLYICCSDHDFNFSEEKVRCQNVDITINILLSLTFEMAFKTLGNSQKSFSKSDRQEAHNFDT